MFQSGRHDNPRNMFRNSQHLRRIVTVIVKLVDHLYGIVSDTESEKDAELYTDELNYTKICIGLCLRFFAAFFTWSNFQLDAHKPLLRGNAFAVEMKAVGVVEKFY